MTVKISLIGAGSGAFSLSLIRDICLTENLRGSTVSFMDINPQRLEAAFTLCQRYARELNFDLKIEKTLNRQESLEGAHFVVNTALAASHDRLQEGWQIARKYGYDFGGSFHVLYDEAFWVNFYQLRLMESIIQDGLKICPDALHLMVANPVLAGITYLGRKYPQAKIVGLCHGFGEIYKIADLLGMDRKQMTYEIPGVNHFVWLNRWSYQGQDAYPILDRWIETEAPKRWQAGKTSLLGPKTIDLYRRFGRLPIGDTAHWSGACWPCEYHSDAAIETRWQEKPLDGWNGYFNGVAKVAQDTQRIAADPSTRVTDWLKPEHSGEPMVPIIEAVAADIPRVVIGNMLNTGQLVPGIPADFEVEIPIFFNARGMQGISTQALPRPIIAHILRDRVATTELELEAFQKGSQDALLQLILMDPWSHSRQQAARFLEEILALPYHQEMRDHYQ